MAKGRIAIIFSIVFLAIACHIHSVVGVKVYAEVASLNETARNDDDIVEENEVPLSQESKNKIDKLLRDHPHNMYGKPTKFDIEDKSNYQIEPTRIANVTANPIEMNSLTSQSLSNSTECKGKLTVSCIRKDFSNFLDQLSRVDTYNVTESVQIIRNPEVNVTCNDRKKNDTDLNLLDKVHHYAKTHVMKIQLNKDLSLARKARTFFGCEFLDRLLQIFVACVLVPLLLSTRKVDFLKLRLFILSDSIFYYLYYAMLTVKQLHNP